MKYIVLTLMALLAFAPATFAVGNNTADQEAKAQAAKITVKGKVIDEEGGTLPGASVTEKGSTNGTITDLDGNFTLSVDSEATLVVSFMGYKTVEVPVNGKTDLGKIVLGMNFEQLEQVVVIGYGTQRKVDLTGSVTVVDADELKKASNSNISTMMQGRAAGVQITSDGQPGADPVVRIRGIGSFGNTNPLYIVDGVPMGSIRDFSPNDIESLQVLKDASAAAIYGSRAANGVIIITTKQGKKEQPLKIDVNTYVGIDNVRNGVYEVMDSEQYSEFIHESYGNAGMTVPGGYDSTSPFYMNPEDPEKWVNTNWFDEVFKTGVRQNHNINFSGGGKNSTYNVSFDYFSQNGTMEGAGPNFDRYTARINNTMDVKFIKIKTGIVYSHSDQDNMALSNANEYVQGLYGAQYPVMASALLLPPTIKAYDESTWVLDEKLSAASQYQYDSYGYGTYYDDVHGDLRVTNVLMTNNLLERNSIVDRVQGTGTVTVDLIDMFGEPSSNHKFDYNLNAAYNRTTVKSHTFVPSFIQSTSNYLSKENERLSMGYRGYTNALIENTLTYDGKFGRHHVNALVGYTFQHNTGFGIDGWGNNLSEPYFLHLGNADETSSGSYADETFMLSYLGRINYNFDDRYLISATIRRDGSSQLSNLVETAVDDRWEIYPSVSAGWRVERESFFPEVAKNYVNLFKIRGSYGELGNINLGPYEYAGTMSRGNYTYSFGNEKVTGSSISDYVNERLIWEKKKTLDFGLDLGLFNNQLEFTFDWYKSTSEDLHFDVGVPQNAGATNGTVKMNAATMVNSGLEFLLAYHNRENVLKYDISVNVSTIKNEVTKLGVTNEPRNDGFSRTEVGREIGQFYGYVSDGIFQSQADIDNNLNSEGNLVTQSGAQAGDIRYKDLNNDGVINSDDRQFLGSGLPKVTFGLNARLEWNNFDFSIFANGAAGFKAVDFVDMALTGSYGALNKSTDLLNAWTPENPNTDIPRVAYKTSATINNDAFSERHIQDASYIKIGNVMLGYNMPDKWFSGYVKGVRVYVSGQNLAVISKYRGYNVDFAGGTFTPGYNYASYPTPRTFMFGAHLSF